MTATTSEEIPIGALRIRFLLEGSATGGSLALFAFDVPAGAKVPVAHSHDAYDETVYGLEGVLTWTVGDRAVEVGPGEALFVPRGVVHRFENHGPEDGSSLAVVAPGVLGPAYFRELAAVAAAADGPPDPAEIGAVMRRHGLTPAA